MTLDSVVIWTLRPKDSGTELFLEHTGFEETQGSPMFIAMDAGWKKNMSEKLYQLTDKSHQHEASGS